MDTIGHASIYKFIKEKKILIHSLSKIKMGASIASEPYIWLDENSSSNKVVDQLLYALGKTKNDLPNPENWASFSKEFIAAVGLKKQSDLYKQCINVTVVKENGVISFIPMVNKGNKGFENVIPPEKVEINADENVEEIRTALEKAFEKCE